MPPVFQKTCDQRQALKLLGGRARNTLLFGGSRSGKTFVLLYALLVRALKAPGSRHAVLRLHANAVRNSVWNDTLPKVLRLAFPGLAVRRQESENVLLLPNRAEIWCGGLDTADRADKILGREFATLYFNECSELSYPAVATALTRLAQKTALRNRAYFDCNPPGKSHWSYTLFVRKIDPASGVPLRFPGQYAHMVMNPAGNSANLPEGYLEETLAGLSEVQRMRFLEGRWLDDLEGALWNSERLAQTRVDSAPHLDRVVVGVDPAVTHHQDSDETGIVVAGCGAGRYYVLADASLRASPARWVAEVDKVYRRFQADRVIGEVNNGGDLIEFALRSADCNLSFRAVRASRGKIARAEPIAALYERGVVHHVGVFRELEDQLCSYGSGASDKSPDRMDALVWALTDLANTPSISRFVTV